MSSWPNSALKKIVWACIGIGIGIGVGVGVGIGRILFPMHDYEGKNIFFRRWADSTKTGDFTSGSIAFK